MTIRHHVSEELLISYAAGALGEAHALAIATHAALCPQCREAIADAEALGGILFEEVVQEPLPDNALAEIMRRIEDGAGPVPPASPPALPTLDLPIPEPLRTYILRGTRLRDGALPWRRLSADIGLLPVRTPDRSATALLLRVAAGRPIPEHGHTGLELSVVLSGAFTDGDTLVAAGDFAMADETVTHQPCATPDAECICLVVAAK